MLSDDQIADRVKARLHAELAGIQPSPGLLADLRDRRARRSRNLRIGFTAAPVAAGITAAVVVAGGTPAAPGAPAGPAPAAGGVASRTWLRTAILTAFDGSVDQILYDYQVVRVDGQRQVSKSWFSPADPAPGQVETTREVSLDAAGAPQEDTVLSFRVPSSERTRVPFRITVVEYGTRTWSDSRATLPPTKPVTIDAATVRKQIADGQWSAAGTSSLDGRRVIKLTWHDGPGSVADLWVDAETYLPVEEVSTDAAAGGSARLQPSVTTDRYTYLAPTAANMANLRPGVPSGFTRTAQPVPPPGRAKG